MSRIERRGAGGLIAGLVLWAVAGFGADAPMDRGVTATRNSLYVSLKNLDVDAVRWTDGFWAEKWEVNRKTTIPVIWKALNHPDNGASYRNFLRVAGEEKGEAARTDWGDGDVYKYLESVAWVYAQSRDRELDRHMDEMIAMFARAQEPDGYISTPQKLKGWEKWSDVRHHELYNMGHLMTAASVHYRVTGKTSFLEIATKLGDYLHRTFVPCPEELAHFGFNPSNIMGATALYRATGDKKYLELADTFVSMRGSRPGGKDHNQTRVPLREEAQAVGHAVTANYLYAGAADVYSETGDQTLLDALGRIWDNVTKKKMYVTGAVGNLYKGYARDRFSTHEAYGLAYELPHKLGYNETCANIGAAMWNWRMVNLTGDARYADVMERVLYNSMLSAVGVEGKDFRYNNPLRRHGKDLPKVLRKQDPWERSAILQCYCCPPSVARTIAKLQGWAYAKTASTFWVHLYGANEAETEFAGGTLRLRQETGYPWSGAVKLTFDEAPGGEFTLKLRIPEWAEGATVRINGTPLEGELRTARYAEIDRPWKTGDVVELELPMAPRLVEANPFVEDARGQVAVMRGPIVYALESPDLPPGVKMSEVVLPAEIQLSTRHEAGLLGGVTVIEGRAMIVPAGDWSGRLYRTLRPTGQREAGITLIPYYAWDNRGVSHMTVWMPVGR